MDVLVFTPVLRLEPETVTAICSLEWDGPLSVLFQRDNPTGDPHQDHLHQYQRARDHFLKAGVYDAMLVVESDIIPPVDALKRLAALKADVAQGVYRLRVSPAISVLEKYPDKGGRRARNTGEPLSSKPALLRQAVEAGRWPCSGGGMGCVLISRRVLEQIPFRIGDGGFCDTYWYHDVHAAGFTQMAEMLTVCGHKTADGTVLWPDLPGRDYARGSL